MTLSVCVVHKQRSVICAGGRQIELFPRCIDSLNEAVAESGIDTEIIVVDWPVHRDRHGLSRWFAKRVKIPATVITARKAFSKGRGCNAAARRAKGDVLFFLDCDMLVTAEVLRKGVDWVKRGKAYFPGYLAIDAHGIPLKPRSPGAGNAFMSPEMFERLGGWPEKETWGNFDRPVWNWFNEHGLAAEPLYEREIVPGFLHMYHPKFVGWKR